MGWRRMLKPLGQERDGQPQVPRPALCHATRGPGGQRPQLTPQTHPRLLRRPSAGPASTPSPDDASASGPIPAPAPTPAPGYPSPFLPCIGFALVLAGMHTRLPAPPPFHLPTPLCTIFATASPPSHPRATATATAPPPPQHPHTHLLGPPPRVRPPQQLLAVARLRRALALAAAVPVHRHPQRV